MAPSVETYDPPALGSSGIYSHVAAVRSNTRLIYTAGQIGTDREGNASREYMQQIRQAFTNLGECLKQVGACPKDIVKLTYYIVRYDPANRPHVEVMTDFLQGHRPATTLVPVPCLARKDLLFEVEAVIAVHESGKPGQLPSKSISSHLLTDVIIVGAGLSGLQAARNIHNSGLSYSILEARDRIGGKVWSYKSPKGLVGDLGAAWMNDVNQSQLWNLGKELGLSFVQQNIKGSCVLQTADGVSKFPYGHTPKLSLIEQEDLNRIRDFFETLCHSIDVRTASGLDETLDIFLQRLRPTPAAKSTVAIWTRAMLGVDPSEVTALYFLDYCKSGGGLMQMRSDGKGGGQALRCETGMGSFPQGLASMLRPNSIKKNSAVASIYQIGPENVVVRTRDGQIYKAKKVVLSLPTPLYKEIVFSPELPADKLKITNSTSLGYYTKAIVFYTKPWWNESGLCGLSQSFVGPASLTRDTSVPSRAQYSLTCFLVGELGRTWSKLAPTDRKTSVLSQLVSIFGPAHADEAANPIEYLEQEWSKEEFSKGCPCPVTAPGTFSKAPDVLKRPFKNIHFVGTETADQWKGYMEGALRSGIRGANEVVMALEGIESHTKAML